jgi:outer membrane protein OmpA-like peptidoglycan-associated protein
MFKVNYKNWQEKQHAVFLDIPLTVQYKLPVSNKIGLLASVGANVSFPVTSSYEAAGGQFVTTGFYSQYNVELSDMQQHGFSTIDNTLKGNVALKPAFMAIADLGGLYKLTDKLDLFAGAYINYGLNNILKADTKLIYQPDAVYNGILASTQTKSVTPISIGLKVGIYFHLGDNKPTTDFIVPVESLQPVKPADPVQPVQVVEPVKTEPLAEPIQVKQPIEPVKTEVIAPTVQLAEPVQPVLPVTPVQPVVTPEVVPVVPVQTEVQPESVKPVEPVVIAQPAEPVQVAKPVEPVVAEQPVVPVKTEPLVTKAAVTEPAPKVVETPAVTKVEQPATPVAPVESDNKVDVFKLAQKIAASMNVMFGFNSTQVTIIKDRMIKELSDILKANPFIHLHFVGHTCNIGTHEINMSIGMRRAISVKQKFIDEGVSEAQLSNESKAYDQPLVPNTSKHNRARNRRVEIKVLK